MQKTKSRILSVAEELISRDGIGNTTIAKIARKANVSDSLLYQHFAGKQDLLFSVALLKVEESIELMAEQLQGIRDAESKLSKMIWYGLRYHDQHPGYTRVLMFECRSNREFYKSPGQKMMQNHSRMLLNILREGVNSGIFRDDIDMRLVGDIIYGTLDLEAIYCMVSEEQKKGVDDFEGLISLVMPMVTSIYNPQAERKKDVILNAAEKIFSENTFAKSTISQVAKEAQVAEGSIYDYFKNKEDLLNSVAERKFQEHLKKLPQIFNISSSERKLRRLMRYHFTLYCTNRRFLHVFLTQILYNINFYHSRAYNSFATYLDYLEETVEGGKADGSFRKDVNTRIFRNMFLGAFSHMTIRWLLVEKNREYDRMREIDRILDLLLAALRPVQTNEPIIA